MFRYTLNLNIQFLVFLYLSEVRVGFGAPNYVTREGDGLANITVTRDGSSTESIITLLSIENINATGKNCPEVVRIKINSTNPFWTMFVCCHGLLLRTCGILH